MYFFESVVLILLGAIIAIVLYWVTEPRPEPQNRNVEGTDRVTYKDAFLLYASIILGAVIGLIGGFYGTWFYNTNQKSTIFPLLVDYTTITFFGFLTLFVILLVYTGRKLRHPRGEQQANNQSG